MKPIRAIAFALLALAILVGAIVAGRQQTERAALDPGGADPLSAELVRCRDEGTAAADDAACKEAWAKNRARFFGWKKPE